MTKPLKADILVVDDDPLILQLLQRHMESEGFNPLHFNNVSEARDSMLAVAG